MIEYILVALAITEAAELLVAVIFRIRSFYDLRLVFLVNLMTNPLISALYLGAGILLGRKLLYLLFVAELFVWILEAWIYKKCMEEKRAPFLLSGAANLASILAGYLVGTYL